MGLQMRLQVKGVQIAKISALTIRNVLRVKQRADRMLPVDGFRPERARKIQVHFPRPWFVLKVNCNALADDGIIAPSRGCSSNAEFRLE